MLFHVWINVVCNFLILMSVCMQPKWSDMFPVSTTRVTGIVDGSYCKVSMFVSCLRYCSNTSYILFHPLTDFISLCWSQDINAAIVTVKPFILTLNPLRSKFFRGNINIYLHFASFLQIYTGQVVEILPQIRREPTYSTYSISLLLMSWRHKEPWHQQPWYWPS